MGNNNPQGRQAPAAHYRREARIQLEKVQTAMNAALSETRRLVQKLGRKVAFEGDRGAALEIDACQRVVEALARDVVSPGVKAALEAINGKEAAE
jgi:hypothetical protein